MLKHKKLIIIVVSVVFFLTALTFYANKVLFPTIVKKIALEQAQNFLKRKVEIESIHFNWVRGIIVDKVVIYQKNAPTQVFAQFERLSMAVIFVPGFKEQTLSFPSITIEKPSIHLIRTGETTWNFSDLLEQPAKPADEKPSTLKVSLGAINIVDGKTVLDDQSHRPAWSEVFDDINLKFSLSYNGITFDLATTIPQKKGFITAKGHYMPLTGDAEANVQLKNIDVASYLTLVTIKDFKLASGVIKDVDLNVQYSKERIALKGDAALNAFDVTYTDYHVATSITAKNLDITYTNGPITAKGDIATTALTLSIPQISVNAPKGITTHLNEVSINQADIVFDGSIKTNSIAVKYTDQYAFMGDVNLEDIKARKDKDGIQVVGAVIANNINTYLPNQHIQLGGLTIKPMTITVDNKNAITAQLDMKADKLDVQLPGQHVSADAITISDLKTAVGADNSVQLNTKTTIDDYMVAIDKQLTATGSLKTTKLLVKLADNVLKISTDTEITKGKVILPGDKIVEVSPQLELTAEIPLKKIEDATYEGSITFSDAKASGFPYTPIDGIGLDADFKTDSATINALTVNILDTSLRAAGSIENFKNPKINVNAEANDINLARIKDYIPQIIEDNGLNINGNASLKLKFVGNANQWQDADISALITLDKVNASSSKFNQAVSNINGIIEATPNSLLWRDFKGSYLGKDYALTGKLTDFKNPKMTTTLDGADVQLKADIAKNDENVTINQLEGKYLTIAFGVTGSAKIPANGKPTVNLKTTSTFRLEDVLKMLPDAQRKPLDPLKLGGLINITAQVSGNPQDWKNLTVNATLDSQQISLMQFKLDTLKITLDQSDGKINHMVTDTVFYDGKIHAVASADLLKNTMPFDLALNIDGMDVSKVVKAVPVDKDIRGQLYLTTVLDGELTKFMDAHGKGSLAIRQAYLADFDLLKGILEPLKLIIKDSNILINEVQCNFTMADQKVTTDNLQLLGPTVNLLGDGWVSFDQNIKMHITAPNDSNQTSPMPAELRGIIDIDISGKLASPKVKPNFSAATLMNVAGSKVLNQTVQSGLQLLQKILP